MITNVVDRVIKASNNNEFYMHDEIAILKHLVKKFKLKTITNYSKEKGLSYPAITKRIANKKESTIIIDNINFIF